MTLSTDTQSIQARVPVTASLEDDDGGITGATWQWSRSPNGTTGWINLRGATFAIYTPTLEEDAGNYLRATVSYTDGHGPPAKTANAVSPRVGDPPPVNSRARVPSHGERPARGSGGHRWQAGPSGSPLQPPT